MVVVGAHYHNHGGDRCLPRPAPRSPPITDTVADTLKDVRESRPMAARLSNMAAAPTNGVRRGGRPLRPAPPTSRDQELAAGDDRILHTKVVLSNNETLEIGELGKQVALLPAGKMLGIQLGNDVVMQCM